jgi:hypothetical protein
MPLPALPAAYTAIASLLARKGAVEATKKYGPKAVKEVQKITTKMKKKSKVRKENEFEDTLGSTPASTKLNNRQVEKFLKEHGYKEKNPSKLKEGDISYQFKINNKGKEDILVYEKLGDKITKTNFTNSSLRKLANWQGYAEGGIVKNSLLNDDRAMYKDGGGPGIEALRKEAPEVVARMGYQEGGSLLNDDMPMMSADMEMSPESTMDSDEVMEDNYLDFIIDKALSPEEEEMLMSRMEQDEELSMLFNKVIDVAQEFAGSGPVDGPGTGVSDDIPARLSDGEFVFTAKAVEEIGEDTLMSMMKDAETNADKRQPLNLGGMSMMDEEMKVDQYGKPVDPDIVEDDIRKNMLDVNPRLR